MHANLILPPTKKQAKKSLIIACVILSLWLINLISSLTLESRSIPLIVFQTYLQSLLFVGIFVTSHDSMHGLIEPYSKKWNRRIGVLCSFLFAGFRYSFLKKNHLKHHLMPAQPGDPDYTNKKTESFFGWLLSFMKYYFSLREFLILHIHVGLVFWIGGFEIWKIFVCFAIPSWVASLQLFYFGTYLPHRGFKQKSSDKHNSRSNEYNTIISFFTCFHFGYHNEHHKYPYLAWWRLPSAYNMKKN